MARLYGLALLIIGAIVFLAIAFRFGPALLTHYYDRMQAKQAAELKRLAFERSKDLLALITYDPTVAEAVLKGLLAERKTRVREVMGEVSSDHRELLQSLAKK